MPDPNFNSRRLTADSFLIWNAEHPNQLRYAYLSSPRIWILLRGQNILLDDFGKGAFSMVVVEGLETKEVAGSKRKKFSR